MPSSQDYMVVAAYKSEIQNTNGTMPKQVRSWIESRVEYLLDDSQLIYSQNLKELYDDGEPNTSL